MKENPPEIQNTNTYQRREVPIVKNTVRHIALCAIACAGLGTGIAEAKPAWQAHSGGRAADAARGGIAQTSDGGFITVGESQSFGAGDYDVYLVKTDFCGAFEWAMAYDIGGNDHGRSIKETSDGGYIITGETENLNNCCSRNDAFLMKLARDGSVEWTNTYGGRNDDGGSDVILYNGRTPGYLIAGASASFGAGGRDAWLIATDLAGNVAWSRVYGGASNDAFNGVIQTENGEIVATGSTASYRPTRPPSRSLNDLFLVRTDNQGSVIRSCYYGSSAEEVGYSVVEYITDDRDRGQLFVAGVSTVSVGKGSAYLLRVRADLSYVTDRVYGGGNTAGIDNFRGLAQGHQSGELVALGRSFEPKGRIGGYDVFAVRVNSKLDLITTMIYGGEKDDEGYALVAGGDEGFGWAGVTNSFTFGSEDMYIGYSLPWLQTLCHESEPSLVSTTPDFHDIDAPTGQPLVWVQCAARTTAINLSGLRRLYELLCSTCQNGDLPEGEEELSYRVPMRAPEGIGMSLTSAMADAH